MQLVEGPREAFAFLVVGGAFLVWYFYRRRYGLLIPACILLGLGLGEVGDWSGVDFHDFSAAGLGVGFIAIYVIDRLYRGSSPWWPLIPGGILLVRSLVSRNSGVHRYIEVGWPLVLVIVGLLVLAGAFGRRRHDGQ
jgi:hypothetical protein